MAQREFKIHRTPLCVIAHHSSSNQSRNQNQRKQTKKLKRQPRPGLDQEHNHSHGQPGRPQVRAYKSATPWFCVFIQDPETQKNQNTEYEGATIPSLTPLPSPCHTVLAFWIRRFLGTGVFLICTPLSRYFCASCLYYLLPIACSPLSVLPPSSRRSKVKEAHRRLPAPSTASTYKEWLASRLETCSPSFHL